MKWHGRSKSTNISRDLVQYSPFTKNGFQYPQIDRNELEIDYILQKQAPKGIRVLRGTKQFSTLNQILESFANGR